MAAGHVLVLSLEGHPSGRLRIGQYIPTLRADGFAVEEIPVEAPKVPPSTLRRIATALRRADVVFVQRVAYIPLNGLLRTSSVRVVYDVDDALHFVRTSSADGPRDLGRVLPLAVQGLRTTLRRSCPDFVISRDLRLLAAPLLLRRGSIPVPWLHEYRAERWEKVLFRRATVLMATNSAIVEDLRADGISVRSFVTSNPIPEQCAAAGGVRDKQRARQELGLDDSQPLVVYTGTLFTGMAEFDYLLLAAGALPDVRFVLTGGRPDVIERLRLDVSRRGLSNVLLTGFLDHPSSAQRYQIAADVLVSYYSVTDHPFARHQLPNKLAEYMATGNPVVVADFRAVRDLATPSTAVLVPPRHAPGARWCVRSGTSSMILRGHTSWRPMPDGWSKNDRPSGLPKKWCAS